MKEQVIQLPDNFEVKEIKDGKIILVEKEKKLTYKDITEKLFSKPSYYIGTHGIEIAPYLIESASDANNCTSERQAEKLLAINKLMNVAKYFNGDWQPNWNNDCEYKYYLSVADGHIRSYFAGTVQCGDVYFKSEKLARQAIEILGEETIKLALCTDY